MLKAWFAGLVLAPRMNIHEYQAKELLEKFGVATTRGKVAATPDEADEIAREIGAGEIVVKAQVHAGGRGKGMFRNGFKGGVHIVKSPAEAREVASKMLGQTLVTHQTGEAGRVVNQVWLRNRRISRAKSILPFCWIARRPRRSSSRARRAA